MTPEEFHRQKLKEARYGDEAIEEYVLKFLSNSTYEFAERYHQEQLKLLSISDVVNCSNCHSENISKENIYRCKDCGSFHGKFGQQL